jgi:EKC/KEOPS complex subunit CGI121/TPRKB
MMLEAVQFPHFPPSLTIYVSLYTSLQNARFLRQQLLAGNREFEYAFIDANMV